MGAPVAVFLNHQEEMPASGFSALREELIDRNKSKFQNIWLRRRSAWRQDFRTSWKNTILYSLGLPRGRRSSGLVSAPQMAWIFRRHGVGLAHIHWAGADHWGFDLYRRFHPRLPYILTFHAFNRRLLESLGLFEPERIRGLMEGASAITAVSQSLKNEITAFYSGVGHKIRVLPNGVNVDSKEDESHLPLGIPDRFILSAGGFYLYKGADLLLWAFLDLWREKRLDIPLVLCGHEEPPGRLRRLVAALGLERTVILFPNLPRAAFLSLMRRCLFFVSASRTESFGLAVMEAMTCAKAVAAPRAGGIPEYLIHERNGLSFEAGNLAALKEAVIRLAGDGCLRQALGQHAAQTAAVFSWSKVRESYDMMHEEALSGDC